MGFVRTLSGSESIRHSDTEYGKSPEWTDLRDSIRNSKTDFCTGSRRNESTISVRSRYDWNKENFTRKSLRIAYDG